MKYEWRKQDKALYGAKKYPALITIPAQNYIMISGKGNPNDVDFSNRVGAFDDEPVSFEKMDQFSVAHGLRRSESYHREIYLSNANRVEKSKLKTILRYSVEQIPTGSL